MYERRNVEIEYCGSRVYLFISECPSSVFRHPRHTLRYIRKSLRENQECEGSAAVQRSSVTEVSSSLRANCDL